MEYYAGKYDIAVIGAGHAGCEAALAAARMGFKTLIFSITLECVANMPCNPHIGGTKPLRLIPRSVIWALPDSNQRLLPCYATDF